MTPSDCEYPSEPGQTTVAQVERAQLCRAFEALGPNAPTLCEPWDTHHLAAHLVVREGSPLAVVKAIATGSGDDAVERMVADRDFASLVDELRGGPPRLSVFGTGFTDKHLNGLEFFVHHEDVRRAKPGYPERDLPGWALDEIWSNLGLAARGLMRKAPVGAALRRTDTGDLKVVAKQPHTVVVAGLPSELALFAFGRGTVADVTFDGAPDDVTRLESAHFGF